MTVIGEALTAANIYRIFRWLIDESVCQVLVERNEIVQINLQIELFQPVVPQQLGPDERREYTEMRMRTVGGAFPPKTRNVHPDRAGERR